MFHVKHQSKMETAFANINIKTLATVRTFIRGDKEKNKLHKEQTNSIFDWDAAKAYLRM